MFKYRCTVEGSPYYLLSDSGRMWMWSRPSQNYKMIFATQSSYGGIGVMYGKYPKIANF